MTQSKSTRRREDIMASKKPTAKQKRNRKSNKLEMEQEMRSLGIIDGKKLPNMTIQVTSGLSSRTMSTMLQSFLIIILEV